jgi:hypothetical protein
MKRLAATLRRPLSFLLLPLSMLPLILVAPQIVSSHEDLQRTKQGTPLPAPDTQLTRAQLDRFVPVAPFKDAVPVIAYEGITPDEPKDPRDVSRAAFAEQMAALRQMGFRAISLDQYLRFRRGDSAGLPERPILITVDGGRLDSFRSADKVLQRYGLRATMFVRTAESARTNPAHLRWSELHKMSDSGRWDIQPTAHDGGRRIAVDAAGTMGPYYANRRFTRSEGRESLPDFEKRVTLDVFSAKEQLAKQGFDARAIALPYGDYGQLSDTDPAIAPFMRELLHRQFAVFFVSDPRNQPDYTTPSGPTARFRVSSAITTDRLYMWLRDSAPEAKSDDDR